MSSVLKTAREVLSLEAEGILRLRSRLGAGFERAVELILASPGKVITTGIGKSGIVARKVMATFNSTGTTSIYLHPVEAMHGDLGIVSRGDVVLAISHSGETGELVALIPVLKEHGASVVSFTGGLDSSLAQASDVVVDCGVEREACPLGLAPTTSTTAALAMGDALAVVLIEKRQFNAEDFRRHHPGGKLGEHLSLKVSEVMIKGSKLPNVRPSLNAAKALEVIQKGDLGTVLITSRGVLQGIFTDGDLRRTVLKGLDLSATAVGEIMTRDPLSVGPQATAAEALHLMEEKLITALPVVDERGKVLGIVHLHDLLGRGRVSFRALTNKNTC
ncbi:arabinose 5-phosphate isomerase [Desulfocarbo indianensis]|nr:arabinose 5-phosphate isomerase [Desulfocarbo indianensis]